MRPEVSGGRGWLARHCCCCLLLLATPLRRRCAALWRQGHQSRMTQVQSGGEPLSPSPLAAADNQSLVVAAHRRCGPTCCCAAQPLCSLVCIGIEPPKCAASTKAIASAVRLRRMPRAGAAGMHRAHQCCSHLPLLSLHSTSSQRSHVRRTLPLRRACRRRRTRGARGKRSTT